MGKRRSSLWRIGSKFSRPRTLWRLCGAKNVNLSGNTLLANFAETKTSRAEFAENMELAFRATVFAIMEEKMKKFLIKIKTRSNAILSPNKVLCSYEIEADSESEARARALEMFAREKYGAFLSERDLKIKIEKI